MAKNARCLRYVSPLKDTLSSVASTQSLCLILLLLLTDTSMHTVPPRCIQHYQKALALWASFGIRRSISPAQRIHGRASNSVFVDMGCNSTSILLCPRQKFRGNLKESVSSKSNLRNQLTGLLTTSPSTPFVCFSNNPSSSLCRTASL